MSKSEILAELPQLSPPERGEILDYLLALEAQDGASSREREVLDQAQAAYDLDQDSGESWKTVEAQLRDLR